MEYLIEPVIKTIAENIPDIAQQLVARIDEHIENQDSIKRSIAKAARWSANINDNDIKQYLFRMVASFEFRQALFEGLQSLVREYKNRGTAPFLTLQPSEKTDNNKINFKQLIDVFFHKKNHSLNITRLISNEIQKITNQPRLMQFIKGCL